MNYIIYMKSSVIKFFRDYCREKYSVRVRKIPVAIPVTCPNINGTKGRGGCIYCFRGSKPEHIDPGTSLREQIRGEIERARKRYGRKTLFFLYFQSYTNTYLPLEKLKEYYDSVLDFPEIVGLDVGTRPDCAPDHVLDLLRSYSEMGYEVWIELGLQTANFETLKRINRKHGLSDLVDAVIRAKERELKVCVHTIIGLPGEGREDFLETAKLLSALCIDGVKIHPIYVMRNTPLARLYEEGGFRPLSIEEYTEEASLFLEYIHPETVVHRLTAEAKPPHLLAPDYCTYERKLEVIRLIEEKLKRRKSRQGARAERRGLLSVKGTGGHRGKGVEIKG